MKKYIPLLIIFVLAILVAQVFSYEKKTRAAAPSLPSDHLWPSVKTLNYNANHQPNDWVTSHYDWLASTDEPISYWYDNNSNVTTNIYYEWVSFGLLGEWETKSPDLTGRWYNWNVQNNKDWEDGFLHVNINTFDDRDVDVYGSSLDAKIRYVNCSGIPGQLCPDASYPSNNVPRTWGDAAWNNTASLSLAAQNSAVYFGRLDRFDQINVTFNSTPPHDWQGAWKYSTGQNTWADLPISSQSWNGTTWTVNFSPPPTASQWKRAKVNDQPTFWGDAGVYYIKLQTTTNTGGPTLTGASGRGYWTDCASSTSCSNNGTAGILIPGWDPANDHNGDGYAESNTNPSATAKFKYESRIPLYWSWASYASNLANTDLRQMLPQFAVDILNTRKVGNYKDYGAYLDDSGGSYPVFLGESKSNPLIDPTNRIIEYPNLNLDGIYSAWQNDWISMISYGKNVFHNNNYAMGGGDGGVSAVTDNFDFILREGSWASASQRATTGGYQNWEDYMWAPNSPWSSYGDEGKQLHWFWMLNLYSTMERNYSTSYSASVSQGSKAVSGVNTKWTETVQPGSVLDIGGSWGEIQTVNSDASLTLKDAWPGNSASNSYFDIYSARDKMDGLTSFMVMQNQDTDYLGMWQCCSYYYYDAKVPWANWIPAYTQDYGLTTGIVPAGSDVRGTRGAYLFSTGDDPSSNFPYYIYGRDYTKSLVLYRPVSYVGKYDSSSAVTLDLPSNDTWYPVDYYGNIASTPVTQVTLKGADGIILMKGSAMSGVTLSKSVDKTSALSGDVINYTIKYNVGNQNANNIKIEDNIPNGTTFVSAQNNGAYSSGKVIWNLGNLNSGSIGTVSFQVRIQ